MMEQNYTEGTVFNGTDFKEVPLAKGEYECCRFIGCDFSNSDISEVKFLDCEFAGCNLSLVRLDETVFRDIKFVGCKMLGLRFDSCNKFGFSVSFEDCFLSHSLFYATKIRSTTFRNSRLQELDFTECDLTGALFDNCDLTGAVFDNTIIERADFRTSFGYAIDPEINRMKKAKFSLFGLAGLLGKYNIDIENVS